VLFQNDDYGKDYLKGLRDGLGAKAASMTLSRKATRLRTSIDGHIVKLKSLNADVFFNITTPKFAAQAIKKMAKSTGSRCTFSTSVSSIGSVMKPAGFEASQDIISSNYLKDTSDPQWKNDAGMKALMSSLPSTS